MKWKITKSMAPNLAQNKTFILYKIPRRLLGAKSSLSQVPGTQVTRVTRQTSLTLLAPQQTPVIVEVCRKQHRGIKGSRENAGKTKAGVRWVS